MSRSLIAFDTDHIKGYVFGTNKLKEIRGASSILDWLNREETVKVAKDFGAETIYANGGSALFVVDSQRAEELGKEVQKLYREKTGGGTSITYAVQDIPGDDDSQDIMTVWQLPGNVSMADMLKMLRLRLQLAKDSLHIQGTQERDAQEAEAGAIIALPSHALLCACESCGVNYAVGVAKDTDDPDEDEGRYCRVCLGKRKEDGAVKEALRKARETPLSEQTLWGRIIKALDDYVSPDVPPPERPKDFNVFRQFAQDKPYLGLIYADANNMGRAFDELETLQEVHNLAEKIDNAVFTAMAHAIRAHLPLRWNMFPFDVLLVGGDDIVIVTRADKALPVAHTLADQFQNLTEQRHTLSIGVVLAPVNYPFRLQQGLAEGALKAAKKAGAQQLHSVESGDKEQGARVNFVVVTGNINLEDYQKQYKALQDKMIAGNTDEFYATMRPYTLEDLKWLLDCVREGNERQLGRTKLHQLREAILKKNKTTTILESLMVLRNWREKQDRDFIKRMAQRFDERLTPRQQQMGTIFPWSLDGKESSDSLTIYRTPLLDFIELYEFVSS